MEYWKASVSTLQGTQLKVAGLPTAILDGSTYYKNKVFKGISQSLVKLQDQGQCNWCHINLSGGIPTVKKRKNKRQSPAI